MQKPFIKINDISRSVGHGKNKKDILNNVSFDINENEWIGLIGENGAGKTSLVEIISGIVKPTSGSVEYLYEFNKNFREEIGFQFQHSEFPFALSVKDMVKLSISSRGLKLTRKELNHILTIFGVKGIYHRRANSLSGGQKQKVNILMSVIHKPKFLILDEFSSGLDIGIRRQILAILSSLKDSMKMSGIVVSHHLDEIEKLCTKVVILKNGKVKGIFETKELIKKYGSIEKYVSEHVLDDGGKYEFNF